MANLNRRDAFKAAVAALAGLVVGGNRSSVVGAINVRGEWVDDVFICIGEELAEYMLSELR
jgi:hypothetical protein